jgi:(p)ppGpp synthase/HD superfamily hydrolase
VARRGCDSTFPDKLPQTRAAVAYASQKHAGQLGTDGGPFIAHPLEVASLLQREGAPDHLIAAGVMHDLIEKAGVSDSELHERFGPQIAELVLAVSEDRRLATYASRKAALRRQVSSAGDEALTLFAADKLAKLRELGRELALTSDQRSRRVERRDPRARRLRHYQHCVALVEERLPRSPFVRKLRRELQTVLRQHEGLAAKRRAGI